MLKPESEYPAITAIGWDTEGGERASTNLLRTGAAITLWINVQGEFREESAFPTKIIRQCDASLTYIMLCDGGGEVTWTIRQAADRFSCEFAVTGTRQIHGMELRFPFNPRITATTVLPARWEEDGRLQLPAIMNAPDYGQMLLTADAAGVSARLEGNYADRIVDFVVELQLPDAHPLLLSCIPYYLPTPTGISADRWQPVRRGWFGALQPLADHQEDAWCINGEVRQVRSLHPPGMLGNEVLSGNATCSTWMYADHVFWLPQLAPGISATDHLQRTLDLTLQERLRQDGSLVGYWMPGDIGAYVDFLDSHPSV